MNEELLEDAVVDYLLGFLTTEGVAAHKVEEDGVLTPDSLPLLRGGIFAEVDEDHVTVSGLSLEADPPHTGSGQVSLVVAVKSAKETGRAAHMARTRLFRKGLVTDTIAADLNAEAAGVNVQHVEFTGSQRGQGDGQLTTGLNFTVMTNLTE